MSVNWLPKANSSLHSSAGMANNGRIKAAEGKCPHANRGNRFLLNGQHVEGSENIPKVKLDSFTLPETQNNFQEAKGPALV